MGTTKKKPAASSLYVILKQRSIKENLLICRNVFRQTPNNLNPSLLSLL